MRKFLRTFWILLQTFSMGECLLANDGVLPTGKRTSATTSKFKSMSEPAEKAKIDCKGYLANPESGELLVAPDNKHLYFLSRQAGDVQNDAPSYIYEVDLEKFKMRRIVSLKVGDSASLVGHGSPLEALTILDFQKIPRGCGEGRAAGITIKWQKQKKIVKSFGASRYKLVPSKHELMIADLASQQIKMLDPNSHQKRTLINFKNSYLPLYVEAIPLKLIAFNVEQSELAVFDEQQQASSVLKLKAGMRLVQDRDKFGIVLPDDQNQILRIKQVKGWSGETFRGFDIQLPEGVRVDRVGVAIDFESSAGLVYGADLSARRELRQILVYDGAKGKQDRVLKAAEGQYFSEGILFGKGPKILLLSRSLLDDSAQSIRIGEMGQSDWREIAVSHEPMSADSPDPREGNSSNFLEKNKSEKNPARPDESTLIKGQ